MNRRVEAVLRACNCDQLFRHFASPNQKADFEATLLPLLPPSAPSDGQSAGERIVAELRASSLWNREGYNAAIQGLAAAIDAAILSATENLTRQRNEALDQCADLHRQLSVHQGTTEPNEKQFPNVTKPC